MTNRDPRFDRNRRPDARPGRGEQHQMNMRAHHDIERSAEYYDASHSNEYYPERYLQQALNWNNRDLTQTDNDHPEVQRQFRDIEDRMDSRASRQAYSDSRTDSRVNDTASPPENYAGRGPKGYTRSDSRILEDVCDRLNNDPYVDASDIIVTCSEGIVTLEGSVDSRATKRRAEAIVDRRSGVRDINNHLVIKNL